VCFEGEELGVNAVAHHYDKLEPGERFRLVIEALARDDKQPTV